MTLQPLQSDIANSCWFGGDALSCLLSHLTSAFGGTALFGLLLAAILFLVFYVASDGSLATPIVALILTGTVTASMLPPPFGQLSYALIVIGVTAAIYQVLQKYVLSGVSY